MAETSIETPYLNNKRTALYRHYDAEDELLYIGVSVSVTDRFDDHQRTADWAGDSVRIDIEWFDSRHEALQAERTAIKIERPKYNKDHSTLNNGAANKRSGKHPAPMFPDIPEELPPFQRIQPTLLARLSRMSGGLAQAYLIELGVTPDYVQDLLRVLGDKSPVIGSHAKESANETAKRFINQWKDGELGVPFTTCLASQIIRLLRIWLDVNEAVAWPENLLMAALYRHPDLIGKRARIFGENSRYPKKMIGPVDDRPLSQENTANWLGMRVQSMESALAMVERNGLPVKEEPS